MNPVDNDYKRKVYDNLKHYMGDNLTKSPEEFYKSLDNEEGYSKKVYDNLKHYMGKNLTKTPDEFYQSIKTTPDVRTNQKQVDPNQAVVGSVGTKMGEQGDKQIDKNQELPREDQNVVLPNRNYDLYNIADNQAVIDNARPDAATNILMNKTRQTNKDGELSKALNNNAKVFREIEDEVREKYTLDEIENGEYEDYFKEEFKKRSFGVDADALDDLTLNASKEFDNQIKSPGQQLRDKKKQKAVNELVDEVLSKDPEAKDPFEGTVFNDVVGKVKDMFGEEVVPEFTKKYGDVTLGESLFLDPEIYDVREHMTPDYVTATGDIMGTNFHNFMAEKYLDKVADKESKQIWDNAGNVVGFGADPFVAKENQMRYYRQTMDDKINGFVSPWNSEIYSKISEYEELLTKKEKNLTAFTKKEMGRFIELSNEIQAYQKSNVTQVFDPYSGEYKASNDPNLTPMAGDWAKEVDVYKERYGSFGMSKMRQELDKETLRYEELERINGKYNEDGSEDEAGSRLSDDMKESYQKIQALSDMLIHNYDPAKDPATKDDVFKSFGKAFVKEVFGAEVQTDWDLGKRNADYLTEAGRPVNNEIQSYYTPTEWGQWGDELGTSAGAGVKIGAELFIGNKLKGVLGVSNYINKISKGNTFKKKVLEHAFDANMYGLAYEAAGESYATGFGEYVGENMAGKLGKKLKLNKGGITETILKIGGGAMAEIPAELGGELADRLVSGEDVDDAIVNTLGLNDKGGMSEKLSKVFWHSIALSGGSNVVGYATNRIGKLLTKKKDGTITKDESDELEYAQENYTKEWVDKNTQILLNDEKTIKKYNEVKDLSPESLTDDEKLLKGNVEAVLKNGDQGVIAKTNYGKQIAEEKAKDDDAKKDVKEGPDKGEKGTGDEVVSVDENVVADLNKQIDQQKTTIKTAEENVTNATTDQDKSNAEKILVDEQNKLTELEKNKEDAIRERKTEEVDVGEQAGDGKTVEPKGKDIKEEGGSKVSPTQKKVNKFEQTAKERVAKFKGIDMNAPEPGKSKTVKIQSPEFGSKEVLDEYQVTPADNARGVTVKRKNQAGNFETVDAKTLDETKITVDEKEITLGEYLKEDMTRQTKSDQDVFTEESKKNQAEIESDVKTYVTNQMSDLGGRVQKLSDKRMKSPLRGVKTDVLLDATREAQNCSGCL